MCNVKKAIAEKPEKSRHQFQVSKAKQALNLLSSLIVLYVLLGSAGCEKKKVKPACYEGIVISTDHCFRNVVQIKNTNIGKNWVSRIDGTIYKNCVAIDNLPASFKIVGQRVYFTNYEMAPDVICQALYSRDVLEITAKNISDSKCGENNEN